MRDQLAKVIRVECPECHKQIAECDLCHEWYDTEYIFFFTEDGEEYAYCFGCYDAMDPDEEETHEPD